MRVRALKTPKGAFIPVMVFSSEVLMKKPIFFLIDTGATHTTISAYDLDHNFNCTKLKEGVKAVGVGGIQQCYLINNVKLYFLTEDSTWILGKEFQSLDVMPIMYQKKTKKPLRIPSLLGIDVIGNQYELYYGEKTVFLEFS